MTNPVPNVEGFNLLAWNALEDVCFIQGCNNDKIDNRGPIFLRDGSMHKACVPHWVAVMHVSHAEKRNEDDPVWPGPGDVEDED